MNTVIGKNAGFFVCTIVKLGSRDFGFAEFEGDTVHFHLNQGRGIVAGRTSPEFSNQPPTPVTEGDLIIVHPELGDRGWHATIWGAESELNDAEWAIEHRGRIQPAPVCPPIPKAAPQSQVDRRSRRTMVAA